MALRSVREPAEGMFIAEGAKVIGRALQAGLEARAVLTGRRWLPQLEQLLSAADPDVPVLVAPEAVLERVTGYRVHRGALASMHRPALPEVAALVRDAATVVVVEDAVDHANVGAVFRNAAALGADAVIVSPRCADPLYRRSVKVSMGAVFQVPWTRAEEWPGALAVLAAAGFEVVGLTLAPGARDLGDYAGTAPDRVALVVGAEGEGLSPAAVAEARVAVTIPMTAGVDSLNMAAATAVALWGLRRRGSSEA